MNNEIENDMMIFELLRNQQKVSAKKIYSEILECSQPSYLRYVNNKTPIKYCDYKKLCNFFNISLAQAESIQKKIHKDRKDLNK